MNRREFLKAVVALTGLVASPLVERGKEASSATLLYTSPGADDLIIIGEEYKLTGGLSGEVVKRIVYENDDRPYTEYWDGKKWAPHRLVGVEEW